MTKQWPLWTPIAMIVVDFMGVGLLLPMLPLLANKLQISSVSAALLLSLYPALQACTAPILGTLSDRMKPRRILILTCCGSALAYMLMWLNPSFLALCLGRSLAGAMAGNVGVAQSCLTRSFVAKDRTALMGTIGAAGNIGFLAGLILSAASGALAEREVALRISFGALACIHVLVACGLSFAWRPELSRSCEKTAPKRGILHDTAFASMALLVKSLAFTSFASMLPLYAAQELGLASAGIGITYFFLAILGAVAQARGSLPLRRALGSTRGVIAGLGAMSAGLVIYGYSGLGITIFAIGVTLITVGSAVTNTLLLSYLSSAAGNERQGQVLGLTAMIASISAVVGPFIGGGLMEYAAITSAQLPIAAALILASLVLFFHPLGLRSQLPAAAFKAEP